MLDIKTIFFANIFVLFILSIYLVYLHKKNPSNRALKFVANFVIFYFLGLVLFILRNQIFDFLSIVIATTFFAFGSVSLYVATRDIVGLDSKWHSRYWIPILIVFAGHFIFTYIDFNTNMKMTIYYTFCVFYSSLSFWLFWFYSAKKFKVFDKISSLVFLIGCLIFLVILLRVHLLNVATYYFANTDIFILLPNLYMLILNLWIIALVTYRIK